MQRQNLFLGMVMSMVVFGLAGASAGITPTPQPLIVGYFPNNDNGRGTGFFQDQSPLPGVDNYRMRIRRGDGTLLFSFPFPGPGAPPVNGAANFDLPRENFPLNDTSWETGVQIIVDARDGGLILATKSMTSDLLHPSANLTAFSFDTPVLPADPPGNRPATLTDSRPTGQANHYTYEIIRRTFGPQSTIQVGQANHGIAGPNPVTADFGPVTRSVVLPVVAGQQLFWLRPRRTYSNSSGTNLGRYDVAPKSPNISAETTAP